MKSLNYLVAISRFVVSCLLLFLGYLIGTSVLFIIAVALIISSCRDIYYYENGYDYFKKLIFDLLLVVDSIEEGVEWKEKKQ